MTEKQTKLIVTLEELEKCYCDRTHNNVTGQSGCLQLSKDDPRDIVIDCAIQKLYEHKVLCDDEFTLVDIFSGSSNYFSPNLLEKYSNALFVATDVINCKPYFDNTSRIKFYQIDYTDLMNVETDILSCFNVFSAMPTDAGSEFEKFLSTKRIVILDTVAPSSEPNVMFERIKTNFINCIFCGNVYHNLQSYVLF